ncbi:S9 family peptidase [Urbifossiella limnaea]|uniref:Prolyl tripeptidyl peptidase n=1 Tax=Urbifossiella limnaea TaxID=2528023 RepID=A0A517XMR9_9BACT|nr:S9 family peptidase [Urbifossiella limnaea]QDU18810.1 Prolyl tripeptidyl peptidase precursor [Urbifossiella limnaea]
MRAFHVAAVLLLAAGPAAAQNKRPMTVEDLYAFKRVAAPQISPDGKHVAYQVGTVSLEANKSTTALWVATTDGKTPPKQLTDPKGKRDAAPRWSPDGKTILFESTRSGSSQLWTVPAAGGEPKQVTSISTGAATGIWSPDGTHVAFVSSVFPEFSTLPFGESDAKNKAKDEAAEKNPVKAKVFTKLFYRHWDEYVGDKRQHLFVIDAPGARPGTVAAPRDVTPGDRDANPTSSTFSSGDDFTFTPDGKHLVFTAVPAKDEAWSTNYDLCRVGITNTKTEWETLTPNPAADGGPKFSPDGKKLAWRAQKKPGSEADRWEIAVASANPDGTLASPVVRLGDAGDVSVNEFAFVGESRAMFTADVRGSTGLFLLEGDQVERLGAPGGFASLSAGGGVVTGTRASMDAPPEVMAWPARGPMVNVSKANDDLLAKLDRPRPESVEVPIEGGKMQMWVLKPPGFDAAKKWPVAYLVHGGPQGAWEDSWSFRWNPSLWAAQGYVVVLPNPRGSTGFGQKFVDEISGDWGGKCYRDLVAGLDYVEKQPWADKERMASAGASFGGYMMNWFAVNDISKRFKCLVTHCSVWNFESMWGTTDELWFDEHEHGGLPWQVPGKYREFSPHIRAGELAKNKTPMLVVHNDLDFRCPIGQGHELFSALQRQGVPSRFVNFPDEGHWVLKPKNGAYWHREVFGWLARYAPPGGR